MYSACPVDAEFQSKPRFAKLSNLDEVSMFRICSPSFQCGNLLSSNVLRWKMGAMSCPKLMINTTANQVTQFTIQDLSVVICHALMGLVGRAAKADSTPQVNLVITVRIQ